MSDEAIGLDPSAAYEYPQLISIVCPKCGHLSAFPLAIKQQDSVEYAGVCGAVSAPGMWCDAVLRVRVTSHLFPA